MKKLGSVIAILFFLITPAVSQSFSIRLEDIRGISVGYSMRPILIAGTGTDHVFPTHMFYFNIDGFGNSSGSGDGKIFAGLIFNFRLSADTWD